jgi:hypothetical protein
LLTSRQGRDPVEVSPLDGPETASDLR